MNNIILITGAPASGKSTVSKLVAQHFDKSLHIHVDTLREMMVKGVELPGAAWSDETTRQFKLARLSAIYMAQLYASEGIDVIIDDVSVPEVFAEHYASLLDNATVHRVLLLPSASALIARMKKRNGPFDNVLIDAVPWLYSYLDPMDKTGWHVLVTDDMTIEQTVDEVLKRVQ
jgi:chloramphenicol 3-O-phosphotransferase